MKEKKYCQFQEKFSRFVLNKFKNIVSYFDKQKRMVMVMVAMATSFTDFDIYAELLACTMRATRMALRTREQPDILGLNSDLSNKHLGTDECSWRTERKKKTLFLRPNKFLHGLLLLLQY